MNAANSGRSNLIQYLLDQGLDTEIQSAFETAITYDRLEGVKLLFPRCRVIANWPLTNGLNVTGKFAVAEFMLRAVRENAMNANG